MLENSVRLTLCGVALALGLSPAAAAEKRQPNWAFYMYVPGPNQPAAAEDSTPKRLAGSDRTYTLKQTGDDKNPPDWFPDAHPPMPRAVASGGAGPLALACAACHLTSGMGHPESASLAGLTAAYIERQIADFKSGDRKQPIMVDGKPQFNPSEYMAAIAKSLSDEGSKAAAAYFAQLKPVPGWVRVVEAAMAPKTVISKSYMRVPVPSGGTEPIGHRIIEVGKDAEREELRDPRSGTIAYVPPGSIAKGRALATAGGGKTTACGICHGANLGGLGDVPYLAGRSPVYIFRQLYGFREGARGGASAALMKGVVAQLSEDDMISLAAYVATLTP